MAPGDCAGQLNIDGLQVTLLGASGEERRPLVWLHASHEAGQEIHDRLHVPCALACVDGVDWNRDFSPWPAVRVFARGADFSGGAPAYLEKFMALREKLERRVAFPVTESYLAGYSLAGLFAVYAWLRGMPVEGIGCFSGSLWYDGFADWAQSQSAAPVRLALSIGDREKRTGNPRMAQGEACTRLLAAHWAKQMPVRFWLEKGGHFDHTTARIARGIDCLLGVGE